MTRTHTRAPEAAPAAARPAAGRPEEPPEPGRPEAATARWLMARYDTILLDVMGVLLGPDGPLPHSVAFLEAMNAAGRPYFLLTNIASESEAGVHARLARQGLPVRGPQAVVSAGATAGRILQAQWPAGTRVACLGPAAAARAAVPETCRLVEHRSRAPFDVLLLLDDEGFDFRPDIEHVLGGFTRAHRAGRALPTILLANPDPVYPARTAPYALGPGLIAEMLARALVALYGKAPQTIQIGKPAYPLFAEAFERGCSGRTILIGDQIDTDIAGAEDSGIDSALIATGVNSAADLAKAGARRPTYLLQNLAL
jgi:ribonucleotide monophosphatase NagD (HAD superfamily)